MGFRRFVYLHQSLILIIYNTGIMKLWRPEQQCKVPTGIRNIPFAFINCAFLLLGKRNSLPLATLGDYSGIIRDLL